MTAGNTQLLITGETKVGDLIARYPQLEYFLLSMSAAYRKLYHPMTRVKLGKIASLKQVAQVGGIPLKRFINTLRREAGQEELPVYTDEEINEDPFEMPVNSQQAG